MSVKPIPDGYSTYTPYYVVEGASDFIAFLKSAFGAEELVRMPMPGGRLGHAEVRIGNSMVMLADQSPEHNATSVNARFWRRNSGMNQRRLNGWLASVSA